jgi:hypothetical protein
MANRSIPPGIRVAVLDRDGHKCSYCGSTYDLTIDHIMLSSIAVAKGGTSIIENLRTLCGHCNMLKGSGVRPATISSDKYRVRNSSRVLSHIIGDVFTMTRDELAKALEEYPDKLRAALPRQYNASVILQEPRTGEARIDVRVSRYLRSDNDFDVERAKIVHSIRTNPSAYSLSPRPSESAIQDALLASDEYAQLKSKWKESHDNNIDTGDSSTLKAREEKALADIEVEVLRRTLEAYRILADIIK